MFENGKTQKHREAVYGRDRRPSLWRKCATRVGNTARNTRRTTVKVPLDARLVDARHKRRPRVQEIS
jgi:hypothetical protein